MKMGRRNAPELSAQSVDAPGERFALRSQHALTAAALSLLASLLVPETLGSQARINPLRVFTVMLLHVSLLAYGWSRIREDQTLPVLRGTWYRGALITFSILVWPVYAELNRIRSEPIYSLENPFMFLIGLTFVFAALAAIPAALRRGL